MLQHYGHPVVKKVSLFSNTSFTLLTAFDVQRKYTKGCSTFRRFSLYIYIIG